MPERQRDERAEPMLLLHPIGLAASAALAGDKLPFWRITPRRPRQQEQGQVRRDDGQALADDRSAAHP